MIITVTLNTAVDAAATLDRLELGGVNRSNALQMFPGGKGVNVAKAIAALGGDVVATGYVGRGPVGAFLLRALSDMGVRHDFMALDGDTRLTFLLYDESSGAETIVNNPAGYSVSQGEFEGLVQKVSALAGPEDLVVLSGSVAAGCGADAYARLIRAARRSGARPVLDTSGEALAAGLRARPFMVKPTARELSELLGRDLQARDALLAAARHIRDGGVEIVVVSLGASGAVAVSGTETYLVRPPVVHVVSAIGAGDAMVAGMALSLSRGDPLDEALRLGTAAAASSLLRHGAGMCTMVETQRLMSEVSVVRL
ncbi:MAG: 1-phosphofructokinase family hexose kinase [Armatimonadota bacterium]